MPALIYKPGTAKERVFPLKVGLNRVGRHRDNQVCLNREDVSRHHAEIAVFPGRVILKDLSSSNHSYVNGRRIKLTELNDGDELRFSSVHLRFRATFESACGTSDVKAPDDAHRDAGDDALAAEIAEKGRIEDGVTPERRAELEHMVADIPAQAASTASLLRLPDGAPTDRHHATLKFLLELSTRLSAPSGADARMAQALELVLRYLDVDAAAVLEQPAEPTPLAGDGGAKPVAAEAEACVSPRAAPAATRRPRALAVRQRAGGRESRQERFWKGELAAPALARSGPMLAVDDAAEGGGLRVDCCLPLGQVTDAVLYLCSRNAGAAYTDEDMAFIAELAQQIGVALANARALDALGHDQDMTDD